MNVQDTRLTAAFPAQHAHTTRVAQPRRRTRVFSGGQIAVLLFLMLLVASIPIWTNPLPPLSDYINHLATAHVIDAIGHYPDLGRFYRIEWQPIPNLMMDLVVPGLHRFMDIYLAARFSRSRSSTGICFIGERPFREFLARFLPDTPGAIETPDREQLGTHRGVAFYTLGQREGLSIGGRRGFSPAPWFVAAKDAARNVLVVVQGHDHALLASTELATGRMHWLTGARSGCFRCEVKVRYRQADQGARVAVRSDGSAHIIFDTPQRAVTPGQYAVLYEADRCLGGAAIETVAPQGRLSAAA